MSGQEVADLRRTVRRLVEAASGEALEDARYVLEGHVVDEVDPFERRECEPIVLSESDYDAVVEMLNDPPAPTPALVELFRTAPPTLAELAASRPRVTIPGRYCGDGHGVRIGRLVEDRDGMAQVQVDGFGVVNVPSGEVER